MQDSLKTVSVRFPEFPGDLHIKVQQFQLDEKLRGNDMNFPETTFEVLRRGFKAIESEKEKGGQK